MEILKGLEAAKAVLGRRIGLDFGKISPRSKELFGREMSPEEVVKMVVEDVRAKGDQAVVEYTLKFDRYQITEFEVTKAKMRAAYSELSPQLTEALRLAAQRIRDFHQEQKDLLWKGVEGKEWGQLIRPLERVGLYAPGGTAPLASTVLMIAIPPRVAGVKEVYLCSPPGQNGRIPAVTLAAADIAGVDRLFAIGGAQAIAAMAYGTETVPKVDKICGPGNRFVVLAKKTVFGTVDIDALQGPSEVLVIADETAKPEYCAADLLAQAEHDSQAQAVIITTSPAFAEKIQKEVQSQLQLLPRRKTAAESWQKNGLIVLVDTLEEAIQLSNLYAPEHLELAFKSAEKYLDKIEHAGCIFVGHYSAESIGDYIAGPNHSLPTGGTARFSSPLNILDFLKIIDVVKIKRPALKKLGPPAILMARAEGLEGHARAIEKRLV
ncbi:MAG TPA: histidinol dehydrogenase [Dehalococcoidales bacterium]|nr:histidinol dehydrogenase [Dehalococcoidales bacterium]